MLMDDWLTGKLWRRHKDLLPWRPVSPSCSRLPQPAPAHRLNIPASTRVAEDRPAGSKGPHPTSPWPIVKSTFASLSPTSTLSVVGQLRRQVCNSILRPLIPVLYVITDELWHYWTPFNHLAATHIILKVFMLKSLLFLICWSNSSSKETGRILTPGGVVEGWRIKQKSIRKRNRRK